MCIYDKTNLPRVSRIVFLLYFFNKIPLIRRLAVYFIKRYLKLNHDTNIGPGFYSSSNNLYCGSNVDLGDTFFLSYAPIHIGNNVAFSYKNMVITSTHDYMDFNKVIVKPVFLEDNVWITSNVTILPGVTIGKNSVIGAGSVVTKDIPSDVFAAGNPCQVIKKITNIRMHD